jgi:hypothetical protein
MYALRSRDHGLKVVEVIVMVDRGLVGHTAALDHHMLVQG